MFRSSIELDTHVRHYMDRLMAEAESHARPSGDRTGAPAGLARLKRETGLALIRVGERLAGRDPRRAGTRGGHPAPVGPFAS